MSSASFSNMRASNVATLKQLLKLKQSECEAFDSCDLLTKSKILEDNDWTTVGSSDIGSPIASSVFSTPFSSPVKMNKYSTKTTASTKFEDSIHERISEISETSASSESSSYEDLVNELVPRAQLVANTLTNIVAKSSGLNIVSVKNTKTAERILAPRFSNLRALDSESKFFVPNLPKDNEEFWLPTLCESVAEHISPLVAKVSGVESVKAIGYAVEIYVRLAPELECMTLQCKFAAEE